ncbi:MAG: hypothetical protein IJ099_00330 [Alphaproteobacteria bacterium]|nr:hypothetical protein [Alphaproteobacteria bacterium]
MPNMVTEQQEEIQYIKEQVLAKFPLLGVTMRPLSVVPDDRIGTAATDGHRIIYSPKFFSTLSDEQKQFVFAHEVMHVAFNHILRSKGRNQRLWNIATDSVINQILKNEKLPLTEGGVDIAEAVNHSAEEMYEKLLKKKEQRDQEKGQNQEQDQQQQQSQSGGTDQPQDQDAQNQPEQEQPQDQDGQNQSGQDQPQDQDGQKGQEQSDQQSDGSENQDEQNKNSSDGSEGSEQQKDQSQDGDSNSDQNSSSGQGDENQSDSNSEQSSDNQQGSSKPQKGGQRSQSGSSSQSEDTDWDDSNIDWDNEDEQVGHDTHDIWKEAVEQAEREEQRKQEESKKKSLWDKLKEAMGQKEVKEDQQGEPQEKEAPIPQDENMDAYEKGFLAENQEKRHEMAEQVREQLNRIKGSLRQSNDHTTLGDVGETQTPVVDWKKMLKKSFDEERDRWSYRRSGSENDYMARVEELEDEGRPDTEVMLDVSGSVNIRLLREFLRQLKPLLKSSKLKVGCFDEFVYDFKEIKTKEDIDHFQITAKSQWTENWDAAVRAFSKKKEVNKIIFTDGYPCPGTMPKEDLKGKNVIWIVYGNKDFNPCCGKVIQVSERQLQSYIQTAAPLSRGGR